MKKKRMEGRSRYRGDGSSSSSSSKKELAAAATEIKKGPWRAEEDEVLVNHVHEHGPRDWSSLRSKGLLRRTGKSCRLRWVNKLRPNLKNGCKFSADEERIVIEMQAEFGNKWARIATFLPGRTDNDVKNFWSSRQKRLARILRAQASASSSPASASTRVRRKKKELFLPLSHDTPLVDNPSTCAANHRDDSSYSMNNDAVTDDGNLTQPHVFCPDFSNLQLGFHFGIENQGFLPSFDNPIFNPAANGGQFSMDAALFQPPGGCLSTTMEEKFIAEPCIFMEDLPNTTSDRFEHLPSPSRW
ncbi:hypothetical protein MLD38_003892 [Melastoma candidum]|uniref:Uncharacterized protein n=1 Tax=Melastoma candidum TaxID=119954 RepID=A0ACB9S438_9MYRT|nr:hypothetical protein MLD38_003892 [Melastoma candidum]